MAVLCDAEQGARWKGLQTPSAVYTIDLKTETVVHKTVTRSPAYGLAVGPDGKVYTSNSGGLGSEADRAIGVIDPRPGKLERYIELKIIPGEIVAAGDALFVTSGWYFPKTDEITWNKINPVNNSIITFRVPGVASAPVYHEGKLYFSTINKALKSKENKVNLVSAHLFAPDLIPRSRDEKITDSLLVLDPSTLEARSIIDREGYFGRNIAFDEKENALGMMSRSKALSNDIIVFFRPEERQIVKAAPLPIQSEPAWKIICHKDRIYVSYYNPDSMKGNVIAVYNAGTLQPAKVMDGFGGPVDMLIRENKLFVLCNNNSSKANGEVVIVDLDKLQAVSRIPVGKNAMRMAYVP